MIMINLFVNKNVDTIANMSILMHPLVVVLLYLFGVCDEKHFKCRCLVREVSDEEILKPRNKSMP